MQGAVTNKPVTKTLTWPEREFSLVREIIHAHKHRRKHTELRLVGGGAAEILLQSQRAAPFPQ